MFKNKWVNKFILIVFLIGLIALLYKKEEDIDLKQMDYLESNASSMELSSSLDIKEIEPYRAFIVSEHHGVKSNYEIKGQFIRYLHQNKNIKFLITEISFSSGYLLNEYVLTGNKELLDQVFSYYKGSTFWTQEEYDFYEALYKYNQTLNSENKIKIVGIDIEHSLESSLGYYNYVYHDNIVDINVLLNKEAKDDTLILLIKNVRYYLEFYEDEELNWQYREEKMYENYLYLSELYQIDSFYAQMGAMHCMNEVSTNGFQSFTYFLSHDESSNVKNEVLVFMTFYKDSQYIKPIVVDDKVNYQLKRIDKDYKTNNLDFINKGIYMIKLNKEDSPFTKQLIWYNKVENKEDKVTTDYYQYMVIVSGSKATTPLGKTNSSFEIVISYIEQLWK